MTLLPVIQTSRAGDPGARAGDRKWSPLAFALDRLFPKRGLAPYAPLERLVVLMVVRAMSPDGASGDFNCFLSYATIAKWAGVSLASVKRMLRQHCDGPVPLFYRSRTGQTRGRRHACYRFTLVTHPERFASARDTARSAHREHIDRALRDLQPDRIELQRQREDFGGTMTDAAYDLRLDALENAVRKKIPARALLKRAPASS